MVSVAAVAIAAGLPAGCGGPAPPNIVLIIVDTLRADHLSCYGYEVDTSPFISRLASQGILFERAYSASSWTSPATASMHTSLYPFQHGVTTGLLATKRGREIDASIKLNRIPDGAVTIAEVLKEAGYSTFAVTDNLNITEEQGFSQGFDRFQNYNYRAADVVNAKLREWRYDIEGSEPYFVYVHYNDPHQPYNRRKPWFKQEGNKPITRVTAYDSEIGFVDSKIKELFDLFEWSDRTFVIVTADHGEEFYEHGELGHGHNLYSQTINVPLVVYPASGFPPGTRTGAPVGTIDVLPTIREVAGLGPGRFDEGVSLLQSALEAGNPGPERFLLSHLERRWIGGETGYEMKSVIYSNWKYILTIPGADELYNLKEDLAEKVNLLEERHGAAELLKEHLENFEDECVKLDQIDLEVPVDEELLKELESMGYVK